MADHKLEATHRTEFGKGASRRARRAGLIPAVLYGHGTDPVHVNLPGHVTQLALRQANALLEIKVDGAKAIMALPKQVQRDPITNFVEHVDLLIVKAGEKVSVEVPLLFVGELADRESMMNVELNTLTVLAPATNIPADIEVSIEGLEIGAQVLVGDVKLPEGVEAHLDPELLVLNVLAPQVEAAESEGAEGEDGAGEAAEDAEAAE